MTYDNQNHELSLVVVSLLKGVVYKDDSPAVWELLLKLETSVRDYMRVLRLKLAIDESEGYAFLRSLSDKELEGQASIPRLIVRRKYTYEISLLLVLLRKQLLEFDTDINTSGTRLILSRDQIANMVQIFYQVGSNEAKLVDNVETWLHKIAEMGFVRELRGQEGMFEVRRIIKAYVDAECLSGVEERLNSYRNHQPEEEEDE